MKNKIKKIIKDNYNFNVKEIYNDYFYYNNEKIKIIVTDIEDSTIDSLFSYSNYLYFNGENVCTFLYNNDGKIYTNYDDKKVILLKVNNRCNDICINDIKNISIKSYLKEFNLIDYWSKLIDEYEEKNINKCSVKELIISYYFIGLGEVAIQLMSNYKGNSECLCHLINFKKYNIENYTCPFNYINANFMFDLSDYIKHILIQKNSVEEVRNIINTITDYNDQIYFFACLLFPNYFFDEYFKNYDYNDTLNIIEKIENLLSECMFIFYNNKPINNINWLK